MITTTVELAEARDSAERWLEVASQQELLLRLVEQGHGRDRRRSRGGLKRRRAAIRPISGVLTGGYEPRYLGRLRD